MRVAPLIALVATAWALAAASASAAADPWATVNVCDTNDHPNQIGIRGAMPARPGSRLYMRFRVQYRDDDGRWRLVEGSAADSGWVRLAGGRRGMQDTGWTFAFKPPSSGGAFVLRGRVSFEWRRAGRVAKRARRVTEGGHPGTAGADPEDFSAATCAIA